MEFDNPGILSGRVRTSTTKNDLHPTPACAVRAVLPFLEIPHGSTIWEPATGFGHITQALPQFNVVESDIEAYDRPNTVIADFLNLRNPNLAEYVITNPPFTLFSEFALATRERELKQSAFFAPVSALNTIKRRKAMEIAGLQKVIILSTPVPYVKEGKWVKGGFHHIWVIFSYYYVPHPTIHFVDHDELPE